MSQPRPYVTIAPGDPAPWFHGRTMSNPNYAFDTAAGRYIVMCFFLSAGDPASQAALKLAFAQTKLFDDKNFTFYGITSDARDESEKRVADSFPGYRFFFDLDGDIARRYGAAPSDSQPGEANVPGRRFWMVLDPTMRVLAVIPFERDGGEGEKLFRYLASLPPPARFAGFEVSAPVLILPNVFEPAFCQHLIV